MKVAYIGGVVLFICLAGWFCHWMFQPVDDVRAPDAAPAREKPSRPDRPKAKPVPDRGKGVKAEKTPARTVPTPAALDAWVEELPEAHRKLGQDIVDASDNENLAALRKMQDAVRACPNADVRERFVEALNWFGKDAIVELTDFLVDASADVSQAAFNAWDSAVDQLEDEALRLNVSTRAMQMLSDDDSLTKIAAKFEAADNRKAAILALAKVIDGGNDAAVKAAKEAYAFVAGEEWKNGMTAAIKAMAVEKEEDE